MHILEHEAPHINGIQSEGLAECRAVQLDLLHVSVLEGPKRRLLVVVFTEGRGSAGIPESTVAGDVYAVATVVDRYLRHPGQRWRLREGLDAVRHVDAEVRAGRFDPI